MVENNRILLKYAAALPMAMTAFFSLLYIDSKSIWLDEAYTILFVNLSWIKLWSILSIREANMGIYYVLLKLWVCLFGDSELAVRSLSAIFSIATAAVVAHIGVRIFDLKSGIIAGVLLSLNSFFIHYAQEARGYSLLLFLVALSFFFLMECVEKGNNKYFAALGVTNALILYAHFFGFFAISAQFVSLLFLKEKRMIWKQLVKSALITALLVIPLCIFMLTTKADQLNWVNKASLIDVIYAIKSLTGGSYGRGYILLILYFIACLNTMTYIFFRKNFHNNEKIILWKNALLILWLIFPILCLYLVSMIKPFFVDRYVIVSLPALVLIAGGGISYIKPKLIQKIMITVLVVASLVNLFVNYYPDKKSEWNSVVQTILKNRYENDAVLFYSHVSKYPFEYYYNKLKNKSDNLICVWPSEFNNELVVNLENINSSTIDHIAEAHKRLWVVFAHDNVAGLNWQSKPIVEEIENKFHKISEAGFKKSIRVILYEK